MPKNKKGCEEQQPSSFNKSLRAKDYFFFFFFFLCAGHD